MFKSSKQLILVGKSGKPQNSRSINKMVNTVRVNADHGRDFHPLADHMTTEFLAFPILHQLMFDQTLCTLIVCLITSQKLHTKVAHTTYRVAVFTR